MRAKRYAAALLLAACSAAPRAEEGCTRDGRYVMGTVLQMELCAPDAELRQRMFEPAFADAMRLDSLLTTYSAESPTSRLNARAGRGPTELPPEVIEVLALSRSYADLAGGTFDVTVGPLIALWRQAGRIGRLPSEAALSDARSRVGSGALLIAADGRSALLAREGMHIDLGGIGKGYALDRLAARLRSAGVGGALLDFGRSSIWALGRPPGADGWRLLVQNPAGERLGVVTLRNQALSVSGSLGQSSEIAGRRYGHVIDPRTGWPMERDLLACVVAPSAALAEALSKALLLLGEQEGVTLLERLPEVEGMLAEAGGRSWATSGWERSVAFARLAY